MNYYWISSASQADSAGSIPVIRSHVKALIRIVFWLPEALLLVVALTDFVRNLTHDVATEHVPVSAQGFHCLRGRRLSIVNRSCSHLIVTNSVRGPLGGGRSGIVCGPLTDPSRHKVAGADALAFVP